MPRFAGTLFVLLVGLATLGLIAAGERAEEVPEGGVVGNGLPGSCTETTLTEALAGGGLVTFNCGADPYSIVVLNVQTITRPTTIDGGGLITLTAGLFTRLFAVEAAAALTLESLVLDSAYATDGADGGAISNHGQLTLRDSTIQFSQTDINHSGGAIFSDGPVTITNSLLKNNTGGSAGALFANFADARVSIVNSIFHDNHAINSITGYGGAIWVGEQAQLSLDGSQLYLNTARYGGGIYVSPGGTATLSLTDPDGSMEVNGNHAERDGGGIYNEGGTLNISYATLYANTTETGTDGIGNGGAIASLGPLALFDIYMVDNVARVGGGIYLTGTLTATLDRVILASNEAYITGGGLAAMGATTVVSVTNSDVSDNSAATGGGGGVSLTNAAVSIKNSSLTRNRAGGGGAIYNGSFPQPTSGAGLVVRDTTISQNTSTNIGQGGGISTFGPLLLVNTTILSNTNGLYIPTGGARPIIANTVLHNPGYLNCDGGGATPVTYSGNFASDNTCALIDTFDQQGPGLDPLLGPQQNAGLTNGTIYYPPLAGSPLINNAQGVVPCSTLDQILAIRPDACDIGAVEYRGLLPRVYLPVVLK